MRLLFISSLLTASTIHSFTTKPSFIQSKIASTTPKSTSTTTKTTTQLHVFDFFKQRAEEGVDQLKNLGTKTSQGKLLEGLTDAASYTSVTNTNFASGLTKSRNKLLYDLESIFNGGGDIIEELEDILLQADLGTKTSMDVMEEVRSLRLDSTEIFSRDDLRSVLRGKLIEALQPNAIIGGEGSGSQSESETESDSETYINPAAIQFANVDDKLPTVLFVMGANGMGKTTTIGKLASRLKTEGNQTVLLAACDTFRAGAVEQLEMWGERAEVDCYSPNEQQKSPSAVLYGALDKTIKDKYDTLIVDTSGRLSNNDALTEELLKMKRVIQKRLSIESDDNDKPVLNKNVPHETLLVIDAAQGRMALESAKTWHKEIGLSGLVLTKLDGSARGGSVVAVSRELGLPVKLIGVGEQIEDLRDFDPEAFVDGLLGIGEAGGSSNKDEGKVLASRLDEMRKARDERSKQMVKEKVAVGAGAANGGFANNGGNSGMTLDTSALENDIANNKSNGRSNGTFNKPNKGRKKKNKKKGKKR
jgi:fused signal recognition particle receptor